MNETALKQVLKEAFDNKNTLLVELNGLKHLVSLSPDKVINYTVVDDSLIVDKKMRNNGVSRLFINLNQIVYINVLYKEDNDEQCE